MNNRALLLIGAFVCAHTAFIVSADNHASIGIQTSESLPEKPSWWNVGKRRAWSKEQKKRMAQDHALANAMVAEESDAFVEEAAKDLVIKELGLQNEVDMYDEYSKKRPSTLKRAIAHEVVDRAATPEHRRAITTLTKEAVDPMAAKAMTALDNVEQKAIRRITPLVQDGGAAIKQGSGRFFKKLRSLDGERVKKALDKVKTGIKRIYNSEIVQNGSEMALKVLKSAGRLLKGILAKGAELVLGEE
jgi:hypothetical protein